MPVTLPPRDRRPPRRLLALAALGGAAALATALAGCTPPDALASEPGPRSTLSATGEVGGSPGAPGTDGLNGVNAGATIVSGTDGTVTMVSAGSAEMLSEIPVEIPLVSGDADFVQTLGPAEAVQSYYVIITTPGLPSRLFPEVQASFEDAGFTVEDSGPRDVAPAAEASELPHAAVYASPEFRVIVGVVPSGIVSSTVTYAIVPLV